MYIFGVEREFLNQEEFINEPGVKAEYVEWQGTVRWLEVSTWCHRVVFSDSRGWNRGPAPMFSGVTRLAEEAIDQYPRLYFTFYMGRGWGPALNY